MRKNLRDARKAAGMTQQAADEIGNVIEETIDIQRRLEEL